MREFGTRVLEPAFELRTREGTISEELKTNVINKFWPREFMENNVPRGTFDDNNPAFISMLANIEDAGSGKYLQKAMLQTLRGETPEFDLISPIEDSDIVATKEELKELDDLMERLIRQQKRRVQDVMRNDEIEIPLAFVLNLKDQIAEVKQNTEIENARQSGMFASFNTYCKEHPVRTGLVAGGIGAAAVIGLSKGAESIKPRLAIKLSKKKYLCFFFVP